MILDELTFEVKIPADMDREIVQKLVDRIASKDDKFLKGVSNYLRSQLTYGICDKEVTVEPPNRPRTL